MEKTNTKIGTLDEVAETIEKMESLTDYLKYFYQLEKFQVENHYYTGGAFRLLCADCHGTKIIIDTDAEIISMGEDIVSLDEDVVYTLEELTWQYLRDDSEYLLINLEICMLHK